MYQDWMKDVPILGDININPNTEKYLKEYWEKNEQIKETITNK